MPSWHGVERGTLLGFVSIHVEEWRLHVHRCRDPREEREALGTDHVEAQIGRDRELIKDVEGKIKYALTGAWDIKKVADGPRSRRRVAAKLGARSGAAEAEPALDSALAAYMRPPRGSHAGHARADRARRAFQTRSWLDTHP